VRRDGFLGLYRGATPGVIRSSVLTATQCATYDEVKRWVIANFGWGDGINTQLVTGLTTGGKGRLARAAAAWGPL
jgi:solute carrier family 25 uncoupling protein 8/9